MFTQPQFGGRASIEEISQKQLMSGVSAASAAASPR